MSMLDVEIALMEISWLQWLAIFLSATSAATFATLLTGLVIVSRQRRASAEHRVQLRTVWRAVRGVGVRLTRLDARLLELEESVRRLNQHQEAVDLREPGEQLYQQAIRMARHGAEVGELITGCGLSPGEAELVHRVHRRGSPGPRVERPGAAGGASVY